MRIACLLDRRAHAMPTPLLEAVAQRLARRGAHVEWVVPEERLTRPDELAPEHDAYLLKSQTELGLSLAAILHAQGARIINRYPGSATVRDKVLAARALRLAGVPAPRTWVTRELGLLERLLADGPLVVKPVRGLHGAGVHVLRGAADLAALPVPDGPLIAQDYVEGPGEDLKLYVAGGQVRAVRKAFCPGSFARAGRPCAIPERVRALALRCGRAFGLGLYGLDLVEGPAGPVVVDVNAFPGFRGVRDGAALVAGYLERALLPA